MNFTPMIIVTPPSDDSTNSRSRSSSSSSDTEARTHRLSPQTSLHCPASLISRQASSMTLIKKFGQKDIDGFFQRMGVPNVTCSLLSNLMFIDSSQKLFISTSHLFDEELTLQLFIRLTPSLLFESQSSAIESLTWILFEKILSLHSLTTTFRSFLLHQLKAQLEFDLPSQISEEIIKEKFEAINNTHLDRPTFLVCIWLLHVLKNSEIPQATKDCILLRIKNILKTPYPQAIKFILAFIHPRSKDLFNYLKKDKHPSLLSFTYVIK